MIGRHGAHLDAGEAGGFAGEFDGLGAVFSARGFEKGGGALFAVEGLEDFVGAECLEPVGVARVIGFFVEALSGMTVKDWATECGANSAVAVATAGAVATCEDELELAGAGLTEKGDGGAAEAAVAFVVLVELTPDFFFVFVAVETVEDLADEVLLVGGKDVADGFGADVPVVVDFEAEWVVVGEAEGGGLGFVKAFVELLNEGL